MTECPLCHKKQSFRRNGSGRYFCSECFVEAQILKGYMRVFVLTASGNAIMIKNVKLA